MGTNTKPRPESWSCTSPRSIASRAATMEVMPDSAFAIRRRFLMGEVRGWQDVVMESPNDETVAFDLEMLTQASLQLDGFGQELKEFKNGPVRVEVGNRLSDERISEAKAYPIEQLVGFIKGQALAWCHPDKKPSLYHGTKNNIAICPVCDKKFNPIDVLMTRDGKTFTEAVKELT